MADRIIMSYKFIGTTRNWGLKIGNSLKGLTMRMNVCDDDDFLVYVVSLSSSGNRIALQDVEGNVIVCDFDFVNKIWKPVQNSIVSTGAYAFRFDGETISLSSDGSLLAVASPLEGVVRTFGLT